MTNQPTIDDLRQMLTASFDRIQRRIDAQRIEIDETRRMIRNAAGDVRLLHAIGAIPTGDPIVMQAARLEGVA